MHWRHLTAQVAIMSVIFHALMAAIMLHLPSVMAFEAKGASAGTAFLCTSHGFELAVPDKAGGQTGRQAPASPCPICDGIATSAFLLETAQTALIGRLTNPTVLRPSNELSRTSIVHLAHRNRGPPFSV
jgi:hypothetical protein